MSDKKMFLDNIPTSFGFGNNKYKLIYNWSKSIGMVVDFVYEDIKGSIKITNYNSKNQLLSVLYNGDEYTINSSDFKECRIGGIIGKHTKRYKYEIGNIINDVTILSKERYAQEKAYHYKCNNCGFNTISNNSYPLLEYNIKYNKTLCSCCSGKVVIKGINDIGSTKPSLVKYFVNEEDAYSNTYKSNKIVTVKCLNCGQIKNMQISNLYEYGVSCKNCNNNNSSSLPERFMANILKNLKINFIPELSKTTFDWCERYRYDFYLPDYKLIIEMDGSRHYTKNNDNENEICKVKQVDIKKDMIALNNNVYVIRIDCNCQNKGKYFSYLTNNIRNSVLNHIFDFNQVNFEHCMKDSLLDKDLDILNKWKTQKYNPKELANMFNVSKTTITRLLNLCSSIGECEYDRNTTYNLNKKNGKGILYNYKYVYKLDKDYNVIEMIKLKDAVKKYKNINKCLNGEREFCGGYRWRRVDESLINKGK